MYIEIRTIYEPHNDMTFIVEEVYKNGEPMSTAVIGWHFGEPGEHSKKYIGKLKATYEF